MESEEDQWANMDMYDDEETLPKEQHSGGWSGAWKGWVDSSATVSPAQNPEHASDERATTALHDAGSLTVDDSHDLAPLLLKCAQGTQFRTQGTGRARRAREEDARRIYGQKCNEAAGAQINSTSAIVDILGKSEALEKQLKTVTMRADSSKGSSSGTKKPRTT